jgi:hypothetical protein
MSSDLNCCRVCGYRSEMLPYGEDGRTADFWHCPCCGVEHGYQDFTPIGAHRFRRLWLDAGAQWDMPEHRPPDWDLAAQLKQVPEEYLDV